MPTFETGAFDLFFASQVLSIVLIDIVLSGDNAVVIGMAARSLSPRQRKRAIVFGALGAICLRIFFTALAAILLMIPLLQFLGGLVLVWIAWKLLRQEEEQANVSEAKNLLEAIRIIVLADVIMSLDNILAVGAAAHGNLALLLFGLFLSMGIIMFCSNLVAILMHRFPVLVWLGAAVLAWVAAGMIVHDKFLDYLLAQVAGEQLLALYEQWLPPLVTIGVLAISYLARKREAPAPEPAKHEVEVH